MRASPFFNEILAQSFPRLTSASSYSFPLSPHSFSILIIVILLPLHTFSYFNITWVTNTKIALSEQLRIFCSMQTFPIGSENHNSQRFSSIFREILKPNAALIENWWIIHPPYYLDTSTAHTLHSPSFISKKTIEKMQVAVCVQSSNYINLNI